MNLRAQAAADIRAILEDTASGFGWPITVRDPTQLSADLVGFSNDIAQTIDPQTGMVVSDRVASVALSIASLIAAGFKDLPRAVPDKGRYKWIIRFNDINGKRHTFAVRDAMPDRAAGVVTCTLEAIED